LEHSKRDQHNFDADEVSRFVLPTQIRSRLIASLLKTKIDLCRIARSIVIVDPFAGQGRHLRNWYKKTSIAKLG